MPSTNKFQTSDLRSEAREYQRDRNHNAKWARGIVPAPVKFGYDRPAADTGARPQHRDSDRRCGRHFTDLKHNWARKETGQKTTMARKLFRTEVAEATDGPLANVSDSSGEEDVYDASSAPIPGTEILYSYDAVRGPGKGDDILSHAITKAVQRFEHKETEKLAKEYEFVDNDKDSYAADDDDEEFEMIDHSHFH